MKHCLLKKLKIGDAMIRDFCEKKIEEIQKKQDELKGQMIPYRKFRFFKPFTSDQKVNREQYYSIIDLIFRRKELKAYKNKKEQADSEVGKKLRNSDEEIEYWTDIKNGDKTWIREDGTYRQELTDFLKTGEVVLTKEDLQISRFSEDMKGEEAFTSLDDFLLVHKTDYLPIGDTLRTSKSTSRQEPVKFTFRGKEYTTNFLVQNDATHFTINGPVADHDLGNWSNKKYAVIVSLQDVDRSNLYGVKPEDTVFTGSVSLGKEYYLLVPKDEMGERINGTSPNPKAITIGYEGITLDEAINMTIDFSGRKSKYVTNNNGWREIDVGANDWDRYASPFLESKNIPVGGTCFDAEYEDKKRLNNSASISIAILKFLKANNLNPTKEEVNNLLEYAGGLSKALLGSQEKDTGMYDEYYLQVFRDNGFNMPKVILSDQMVNSDSRDRPCRLDVINSLISNYLLEGLTTESVLENG